MDKQALEQIWLGIRTRIGQGEKAHDEASVMSVLTLSALTLTMNSCVERGAGLTATCTVRFLILCKVYNDSTGGGGAQPLLAYITFVPIYLMVQLTMVCHHHSSGIAMYTSSKQAASTLGPEAIAVPQGSAFSCVFFLLLLRPHGEHLQQVIAGEQACSGAETATLALMVADVVADALFLLLQGVTLCFQAADLQIHFGVGLREETSEDFRGVDPVR